MFADIKRTKIVATLGPASNSEDSIRQLIAADVNTFRLNFSHGTHEEHGRLIELIKKIRKELEEPVAILQDLSG
ncbi:MAG: pyruvate kinase, partial [Calditrichia bacterium]